MDRSSSRIIPWLCVLAGLALGVAGTLLWQHRAPPPPVTTQAGPEEQSPLRAAADAAPVSPPAPRIAAGLPPEPAPLPSQADVAREFSSYEAAFRADRPDPAWAQTAEKSLMEAASEPALTEHGVPAAFDATCMGRMCKVVMSFDSEGQAGDWSELYVLGMAGAVGLVKTLRTTDADGKPQLIFYGVRKGSEALLTPSTPAASSSSAP